MFNNINNKTKIQEHPNHIDQSTVQQTELPEEILFKIFSYLPPEGLCKSAKVCKEWEQISSDNRLWLETFKKYLNLNANSNEICYKEQIREIQIFSNRKYSVNQLEIKLCDNSIEENQNPSEIKSFLTTKAGLTCLSTSKGDLQIWDLNALQCLNCLKFKNSTKEDSLCHLLERKDGTILIGFKDGTFCIFDLEKLEILYAFKLEEDIDAILELKDGRIAYLADGCLYLYDIKTDKCLEIKLHTSTYVEEFSQLNDTTLLIARANLFATVDFKHKEVTMHWNMYGSKKIGENAIINDRYSNREWFKKLSIYSFDPSKTSFVEKKLITTHGHHTIDFFPLSSQFFLCQIDGELKILDLNKTDDRDEQNRWGFDLFNLPRNLSMRDCSLSYPRGKGKLFIIPKKLSHGCAEISVVDLMATSSFILAHIAHSFKNACPLHDSDTPSQFTIASTRDSEAFYDILPRFKLMDISDQNAIYEEFYKIIRPFIPDGYDYWGIGQQVFDNTDKTIQVTHQQRAAAIENFLISRGYDLDSLNRTRSIEELPEGAHTFVIEDPIKKVIPSIESLGEIEGPEGCEWLKFFNIFSKEKCSNILNVSIDFLNKVGLSSAEDLKVLGIDVEMNQTVLNLKKISDSFINTIDNWKANSKTLNVHEQYENIIGFIHSIQTIADILDKKISTIEKIMPHAKDTLYFLNNLKLSCNLLKIEISQMNEAKESPGSLKTFVLGDRIDAICAIFSIEANELAKSLVLADQLILHTYLHQWGIYSEVWKKLKETNEELTLSQLKTLHPHLSIEDFFAMAIDPVFLNF